MTFFFVCHRCSFTVCCVENSSTAFPYYMLKELRCPFGHLQSHFEEVGKTAEYPRIPRNYEVLDTQDKIREKEKSSSSTEEKEASP